MITFEGRLSQTNGRLKDSKVGVAVQVKGDRLYLRATFPPKPNSSKGSPSQQRIALGYHANPTGLKLAEQEARKVGALLDCGEFDWAPYVKNRVQAESMADWAKRFEEDYFSRRERTPKTETTFKDGYLRVFQRLPEDEPLTAAAMRSAILATKPDTRSRKRFVDAFSQLAQLAGIEADFSALRGSYSPTKVEPRDLPPDEAIAQWREQIPNPLWQHAYGVIAVYGLRPHEVFRCRFDSMPNLEVESNTKTGYRVVSPFYLEWVEAWERGRLQLPTVTGRNNTDLGQRVSKAFARYKIPFPPGALRHCWAVRTIHFGLPDTIAAKQMGHSVQVHTEVYHHWLTARDHQKAVDAVMNRSDRPVAPIATLPGSLVPAHTSSSDSGR